MTAFLFHMFRVHLLHLPIHSMDNIHYLLPTLLMHLHILPVIQI